MIIDAWAQHPTARHLQDPIFDSLRRWTKSLAPQTDLPVSATIAAMDQAGIGKSLISAWYAPRNVMISNDEVAGFIAQAPDRLVGVGSVDISKPMQAVGEIRRCVEQLGFKAIRVPRRHRPIGGSIRSMWRAATWACPSARRSVTPDR